MTEQKNKADYLVTFHATADAMKAEKCCGNSKMQARLRPVPRELSSSCGLALEASSVGLEKLTESLETAKIDIEALYLIAEGYQPLKINSD